MNDKGAAIICAGSRDYLAQFCAADWQFFTREFVSNHCGGEYLLVRLRATCRAWHAAIRRPARCRARDLAMRAAREGNAHLFELALSHCIGGLSDADIELALRDSARMGHINICYYIRAKMPGSFARFAHAVLESAAFGGRANIEDVMRAFAKSVGGARHSRWMMRSAALGGHWNICKRIAKCADARDTRADWNYALIGAAESGREDICKRAIARGACDWDAMACAAVRGGHCNIAKLARSCASAGDIHLHGMMRAAIAGGNVTSCKLVYDWYVSRATCDLFAGQDFVWPRLLEDARGGVARFIALRAWRHGVLGFGEMIRLCIVRA